MIRLAPSPCKPHLLPDFMHFMHRLSHLKHTSGSAGMIFAESSSDMHCTLIALIHMTILQLMCSIELSSAFIDFAFSYSCHLASHLCSSLISDQLCVCDSSIDVTDCSELTDIDVSPVGLHVINLPHDAILLKNECSLSHFHTSPVVGDNIFGPMAL